MKKFKFLYLFMLLINLSFGNQYPPDYFKNEYFSYELDGKNKLFKCDKISLNKYVIFNNRNNDAIQMQDSQSDASKITFGKIALESLGGAAGGAVAIGFTRLLFHDVDIWEGLVMFSTVPLGLAGGATIVGNLLMEPDGSFAKSLVGVAIGSLIGLPFATVAGLTSLKGSGDHLYCEAEPITYVLFATAALHPIAGSVYGYNHNIRKESKRSRMDFQNDYEQLFGERDKLNCPLFKIQLITVKF